MIKQLTVTDEAAGRRCLSGLQVLINWLKVTVHVAVKDLITQQIGR